MNSELLVTVVNLLLKALIIVFSVVLLPKLTEIMNKKKKDLEAVLGSRQYDLLMYMVQEAVVYVEEEYSDELQKMGTEKKQRVVDFLKRNGFEDFDAEMLDIAIENTVNELTELGVINKE